MSQLAGSDPGSIEVLVHVLPAEPECTPTPRTAVDAKSEGLDAPKLAVLDQAVDGVQLKSEKARSDRHTDPIVTARLWHSPGDRTATKRHEGAQ